MTKKVSRILISVDDVECHSPFILIFGEGKLDSSFGNIFTLSTVFSPIGRQR